jgi:two-component system, NarL family, sensor kinase
MIKEDVRHVFFLCLLLVSVSGWSQNFHDRDSLWRLHKISKPDTNLVLLYIQLGQQYENNKPDSAILLYEAALRLSEELNYVPGIIKYYTNVTYVYNLQGRLDTSLVLNLKSVEIANSYGNPERIGACLNNVGATYMSMKNHEKAIEYFLKAIDIYDRLKMESRLSPLYGNLTTTYQEIGQYDKALTYGEKSLTLARKVNNSSDVISALINLSTVHNSTGQLTKSISVLNEARELAKQTNHDYAILVSSINLFDVYLRMADFKKLKPLGEEALQLATKLSDRESIAIALRSLSYYYFNTNQPEKAEEYASRSLDVAVANGLTHQIAKAYSSLANISILKGDFKKNKFYELKSDSIENTLFNKSIARNIQDLEIKYQSEKKAQQIKQLEQEAAIKDLSIRENRLVITFLLGAMVLIVVAIFFWVRYNRQKKLTLEKENSLNQSRILQLEKEKQLSASEAVLKGQEEERTRLAKDLHDGLGGLLSGVKFSLTNMKSNVVLDAENVLVFGRSLDMLDHSISELRRVAHNMMPEVLVKFGLTKALESYCDSLREQKIFNIEFQSLDMEPRLSSNTEIFLYRIIQELLNNVVKHAKANHVLVQLARHGHEVSVIVEDDGVGFDKSIIETSKGAGWSNIRSRVDYLKGKLDVQSSTRQGTSVHLTFPI